MKLVVLCIVLLLPFSHGFSSSLTQRLLNLLGDLEKIINKHANETPFNDDAAAQTNAPTATSAATTTSAVTADEIEGIPVEEYCKNFCQRSSDEKNYKRTCKQTKQYGRCLFCRNAYGCRARTSAVL